MNSTILKTITLAFFSTIAWTSLAIGQEKEWVFNPKQYESMVKARKEAAEAKAIERAAAKARKDAEAAAKAAEEARHNQRFESASKLVDGVISSIQADPDSVVEVIVVRKSGKDSVKDTFKVVQAPAATPTQTKSAKVYDDYVPLRRYGNRIMD